MNRSTGISYLSLAVAFSAIPINIFLYRGQHAIAQTTPLAQTVILCETDSTAVRVYEEGSDTVMRAYNRLQNAVFMNGIPSRDR